MTSATFKNKGEQQYGEISFVTNLPEGSLNRLESLEEGYDSEKTFDPRFAVLLSHPDIGVLGDHACFRVLECVSEHARELHAEMKSFMHARVARSLQPPCIGDLSGFNPCETFLLTVQQNPCQGARTCGCS